ncbi:MAG: hypothetical protein J0L55_16920 [Caulobacterales bacterium]|nr:hypothetical protein [Caulobacterales bacterium]
MISGVSHSLRVSISVAQRSVQKSNNEAQKLAQVMAAGKKITSVKDDPANYTIAQNLKNEKPTWEVRTETLDRARVGLDWMNLVNDSTRKILDKLGEIVLSAQSYAIGSSQRQALKAEWDQTILEAKSFTGTNNNPAFNGTGAGSGWDSATAGYDWGAIDSFYGPNTLNANPNGSGWEGWLTSTMYGAAMDTFDLVNASAADFTSVTSSINSRKTISSDNWYRHYAADYNRVERLDKVAQENIDRIDGVIGSLEDIDIGALSSQYKNHTAKQDLASVTLRNAINTYSNFAQSLMGNVMRTQNSIRA